MKKLRITLEGKAYEVMVEVLEEDRNTGRSSTPLVTNGPNVPQVKTENKQVNTPSTNQQELVSPLVGNIVAVKVKIGEQVRVGQDLIMLESNGTETPITSPFAGKIVNSSVKIGQLVQEGQLLLMMET